MRSYRGCRSVHWGFLSAAVYFGTVLSLVAQPSSPETPKAGDDQGVRSALSLGLKWLAGQQASDGSWTLATGPNPGTATREKVASTSLALLPFLTAGHTPQDGQYKETLGKGLAYLTGRMKVGENGGDLRDGATMYTQALGAMVLNEACARTKDEKLRTSGQLAVDFIVCAQNPQTGGWRYWPGTPDGDTSVTGWQFTALAMAKEANLRVPQQAFERVARHLNAVQGDDGTTYGYMMPGAGSHAMTAVGLLCRTHLGWTRENAALRKGVEKIAGLGPLDNVYFNYYATRLLSRYGGEEWQKWRKAMHDKLLGTQDKEGPTAGSWFNEKDFWKTTLGRLGMTSLCLMTLEAGQEQPR